MESAFYVIDDKENGGKKVIYTCFVNNNSIKEHSRNKDFRSDKLGLKFLFFSMFRMVNPYQVKDFSIGCLPVISNEEIKYMMKGKPYFSPSSLAKIPKEVFCSEKVNFSPET